MKMISELERLWQAAFVSELTGLEFIYLEGCRKLTNKLSGWPCTG